MGLGGPPFINDGPCRVSWTEWVLERPELMASDQDGLGVCLSICMQLWCVSACNCIVIVFVTVTVCTSDCACLWLCVPVIVCIPLVVWACNCTYLQLCLPVTDCVCVCLRVSKEELYPRAEQYVAISCRQSKRL